MGSSHHSFASFATAAHDADPLIVGAPVTAAVTTPNADEVKQMELNADMLFANELQLKFTDEDLHLRRVQEKERCNGGFYSREKRASPSCVSFG